MKKLISFILIAAVLCFGTVPASAEEILPNNLVASPYYQNISSAASLLTITSTTAKCESTVTGRTNTKSITISQTLQIHWFASWFLTVNNATWEKTYNSANATFTNQKSGLASGTYRVKSDFTVTTTSGQTETITVYSAEKTVS